MAGSLAPSVNLLKLIVFSVHDVQLVASLLVERRPNIAETRHTGDYASAVDPIQHWEVGQT